MAIKNRSTSPFGGWVRSTCDATWLRPGAAYQLPDGSLMVVVSSLGAGMGYVVDVQVDLLAGGTVDLTGLPAADADWVPAPVPTDWFGGQPAIGDVMQPVALEVDGAAFASEFALQRGQFYVSLGCRWYPGEAWVYAEIAITNTSQELSATWEAPEILFGDGAMVPTRPIEKGTVVAPGQTRRARCTFYWPRHATTPATRDSAFAAVNRMVTGAGLQSQAVSMPWFPPTTG